MAQWLMLAARDLGIRGATIVAAREGYGKHGRIHSAHFFELADQPQEVVMAVNEEESERLMEFLKKEGVHLFYAKTPVEFGVLVRPTNDRCLATHRRGAAGARGQVLVCIERSPG